MLRAMKSSVLQCAAPVTVLALLLLVAVPSARAAKWDPVPAADLAATESASAPGVDVEILLSQHQLEENATTTSLWGMQVGADELLTTNFVRAKVYTAKGVEDLGKCSFEFRANHRVAGTEGRVVKPDGTARELTKADIFQTVLKKQRGEREMKQTTFVFPDLEPGDVVEYRWVEVLGEQLFLETFFCQDAYPVREFYFAIGKMQNRGTVGWQHCPPAETSDKDNFELRLRNLPAFKAEEFMPPLFEFRGWIYVARTFPYATTEKAIWKDLSSYWGDEFNTATRPSTAIKKKAGELLAGATTDDEKLCRLYAYCQEAIFNSSYRTSVELQTAIEKHRDEPANTPAKVLELGRGRSDEINLLFGSLARAAGYDVRLSCNASRSMILNVMAPCGWGFMRYDRVAVKTGTDWRYFNPGNYLLPYGMMLTRDEGATTLLCDTKKTVEYGKVPISAAGDSQIRRTGRFQLDGEGTLTGEIVEVFSGHEATDRKADTWEQTIEEATKDFQDEVAKRLPNAEVTGVTWTNLEGQQMPVSVRYQVRVPGYAEQVGKRLVFSPGFFEKGAEALFTAPERQFPILFPHPWEEHDDVEIVLPEGFVLDNPSAPQPVGDMTGAIGATYTMQYSGKTRTFTLKRDFVLGANGAAAFRTESYPAIQSLFAALHQSDTHSIVIKPKEKKEQPPVATATPAAATSAQP